MQTNRFLYLIISTVLLLLLSSSLVHAQDKKQENDKEPTGRFRGKIVQKREVKEKNVFTGKYFGVIRICQLADSARGFKKGYLLSFTDETDIGQIKERKGCGIGDKNKVFFDINGHSNGNNSAFDLAPMKQSGKAQ